MSLVTPAAAANDPPLAPPEIAPPAHLPPVSDGPGLRSQWLHATGACLASFVAHMLAFILFALVVMPAEVKQVMLVAVAEFIEPPEPELTVELDPYTVAATQEQSTQLAPLALGMAGEMPLTALVAEPALERKSFEEDPNLREVKVDLADMGLPTPRQLLHELPKGTLGDARAIVANYDQAFDRITQELLWMLDKGPVLVVWCFDQSESMKDDQKAIRDRMERVYTELGAAQRAQGDALATAITSYGEGFRQHTPKPTSHREAIRRAIDEIPTDPSGKEYQCTAVARSILLHRYYAQTTHRQMALILVTDESGDATENNQRLEQAIAEARAARCRVYVLGREAVFGYPYAHMRWVHPQTLRTHWLPVDRGPETAFVEQLQTDGFHRRYDSHASGYGPYEQTRLARETGGIFFMLPGLEEALVAGEKRQYSLLAMESFKPDWRTRLEQARDRDTSPLRGVITKVIYDLNPYNAEAAKIIEMHRAFSPRFENLVPQAQADQQKARVYLTYLAQAQQELEKLASARREEASPRWEANYDLLLAQVIAYQARIYEYGAFLEQFVKQPPQVPYSKPPNLTLSYWAINTRAQTLAGSASEPYIVRSKRLFQAIVEHYANTPWAARAQWELNRGFGVQLVPVYEPPYPTGGGGGVPVSIPKL